MNKISIHVPEGITYLSDYSSLSSLLPTGQYIFNKVMTGCGATTMFLQDTTTLDVLCSPRKELLYCKAESDQFQGKVHLFGQDVIENGSGCTGHAVLEKINRMKAYVQSLSTSFGTQGYAPKILTTYDSAKHVFQGLREMGIDNFRIVVDEFQMLITDSAFRGDIAVEFMDCLSTHPSVVYLSATPYPEEYLNMIPAFSNLPYVELQWPDTSKPAMDVLWEKYYNGSLSQTIDRIIDRYQSSGCFEETMDSGEYVRQAKEAVFYVNDVSFIANTIKRKKLTPNDTNVICADCENNQKRLRDIGFKIGHAPKEGQHHKTFTFVTKAAFEGTDFYSTCAYTYIFSDFSRKTLTLDISLDLPQIMGRQRLSSNPFRFRATFFCKFGQGFTEEEGREYLQNILDKDSRTKTITTFFEQQEEGLIKDLLAEKFRDAQQQEKYNRDYASVIYDSVTNEPKVVSNQFVTMNEIRFWQIQQTQYKDGYAVTNAVDDAFALSSSSGHTLVKQFINGFHGTFEEKMRRYAEFLYYHPECQNELQGRIDVPTNIKEYYNRLGYARLHSIGWKEIDIKRVLHDEDCDVSDCVYQTFKCEWYPRKDIKAKLKKIYADNHMIITAKATDIRKYFNIESVKKTVNGVRTVGYLLSAK